MLTNNLIKVMREKKKKKETKTIDTTILNKFANVNAKPTHKSDQKLAVNFFYRK